MEKSVVTYWPSDLKKIRRLLNDLSGEPSADNILKLLNKGKTHQIIIPPEDCRAVSELVREIVELVLKCDIPENIEEYIQKNMEAISKTLRGEREKPHAKKDYKHKP